MNSKWYKNSFRRNLVDMHIDDWNNEFLSKFNAKEYVGMLKLANIQTAMLYANSSVGLCYWSTKTGRMHKNLNNRDIFGELLDLCHKEGLTTIAYYSGIFNNWAYEEHPQWRTVDLDGGNSRDKGKLPDRTNRLGTCCPNSIPYRYFVKSQLKELIENYEFNGIYLDMSYWPVICFCNSCKERYDNEIGGNIPQLINWDDPVWVGFQSKRVEWMIEYSFDLTDYIKSHNDSLSVQHNYAPALYSWLLGVDDISSDAHDYLGADRYEGFIDQSFVCKLYYNLTKNFPFEYQSSKCHPDLSEHTVIKSKDILSIHTYLSLSHNAAFLFIDAIDPVGSLNRKIYERMGEIFNDSKKFEPYLGGSLVEDIAVYYSFNSKIDLSKNGSRALLYTGDVLGAKIPHIDSVIGVAKALKESHVPFGVIAKKNLDKLLKYKTIVLSSIDIFDNLEIKKFYDYVKNGGTLYISGGRSSKYFEDLIGIKYVEQTLEYKTYISPTQEGKEIFIDVNPESPLSVNGPQTIIEKVGDAVVLAYIVLPYTDPKDGSKFASIHSDPPGIYTDYPSVISKKIGEGKIVWSSFPIENIDNEPHRSIFINLIKSLNHKAFSFKSDAPPEVEITLFDQPHNSRYIVNLINLQERKETLKIYNFNVSVNIWDKKIKRILFLPEKKELGYKIEDCWVNIYINQLRIYKMISIEYT